MPTTAQHFPRLFRSSRPPGTRQREGPLPSSLHLEAIARCCSATRSLSGSPDEEMRSTLVSYQPRRRKGTESQRFFDQFNGLTVSSCPVVDRTAAREENCLARSDLDCLITDGARMFLTRSAAEPVAPRVFQRNRSRAASRSAAPRGRGRPGPAVRVCNPGVCPAGSSMADRMLESR